MLDKGIVVNNKIIKINLILITWDTEQAYLIVRMKIYTTN
jgi:hypothetical protein